jgi:hypothetical protein
MTRPSRWPAALVAAALVAAAATARAEPAPAPVEPLAPAPPALRLAPPSFDARAARYEEERRSLPGALAWELIPGAGSLYADDTRGAIITWALIGGGLAASLWGLSQLPPSDPQMQQHGGNPIAFPAVLGGVVLACVGRVYGFVNAFRAADRYNAALGARLGVGVSDGVPFDLTPTLGPGGGGLALSGRF